MYKSDFLVAATAIELVAYIDAALNSGKRLLGTPMRVDSGWMQFIIECPEPKPQPADKWESAMKAGASAFLSTIKDA